MYVIEGMERSERDFKEAYARVCEDNSEIKNLEMIEAEEPDPVERDTFNAAMHSLASVPLSTTKFVVNSASSMLSSAPKNSEKKQGASRHRENKPDTGRAGDYSFNINENRARLDILGSTNTATKSTKRKMRSMYRGNEIKKHVDGVSALFMHVFLMRALAYCRLPSLRNLMPLLPGARPSLTVPSGGPASCESTKRYFCEAARVSWSQ